MKSEEQLLLDSLSELKTETEEYKAKIFDFVRCVNDVQFLERVREFSEQIDKKIKELKAEIGTEYVWCAGCAVVPVKKDSFNKCCSGSCERDFYN